MRVFQLLTTLSFGDAVSNDCLAIQSLLRSKGLETCIYAENVDMRFKNYQGVKVFGKMPRLKENDIMLYHLSTGTELNKRIMNMRCRKFIIYHNTTPPDFFVGYSGKLAGLCSKGIEETKALKSTFEGGFCVSDFNRQQLKSFGYTCPMTVRPILIPFEDYEKAPDEEVIEKMGGPRENHKIKNVLFVGRIAPNKRQEDLISMLYAYRKMYDDPIRLILVGNAGGMEKYNEKLKNYAQNLGIDDIVFPGHISFPAILAYYRSADCFVSMSDHEGFCVPLVEAMKFEVPIIAYGSTAIPETLGGTGILLEDNDPSYAAAVLHTVLQTPELQTKMVEEQNRRLNDFSYENVSKLFIEQFEQFTGIKLS